MKFSDLDTKMRVYETALDQTILPGLHLVARLDGRGFTRLTKEVLDLEKPFDVRFRDSMIQTVQHLMDCGFNVIYGFTESDEISLLFHPREQSFERKTRKFLSILAGEASARFALAMGYLGAFDCRLSTLPSADLVLDYFRWRSEDAHRNALNAHCYWKLRGAWQQPSGGHAFAHRRFDGAQERNALCVRHQLQRLAQVAKARHRFLLRKRQQILVQSRKERSSDGKPEKFEVRSGLAR